MSRYAPIRPTRELKSDADDATRAPADLVDELASELNHLSQTWTDPAAFLERRDFLAKRLRRLARRLRGETPRRERPAPAAGTHAARRPALAEPMVLVSREVAAIVDRNRPVLSLKGSHVAR